MTSDSTGAASKKLRAHIFVCTNDRAAGHPRGCCKAKGSEDLIRIFKQELIKAGLNASVRAQRAGCLDTCEHGPSVVIYPENVWYGKVGPREAAEIIRRHLIDGCPIEQLRIPGK